MYILCPPGIEVTQVNDELKSDVEIGDVVMTWVPSLPFFDLALPIVAPSL
jgi:hypothetical protein